MEARIGKGPGQAHYPRHPLRSWGTLSCNVAGAPPHGNSTGLVREVGGRVVLVRA